MATMMKLATSGALFAFLVPVVHSMMTCPLMNTDIYLLLDASVSKPFDAMRNIIVTNAESV